MALGFGFRCGFLGLLHLEIIQERLEREYGLDLVTTAPGVIYKVYKTNGEVIELTNPSNLPDPSEIEYMEEPMVKAEIMVTSEYIGSIMELCQERRGEYRAWSISRRQGPCSTTICPSTRSSTISLTPSSPGPGATHPLTTRCWDTRGPSW